MAMPTLMEIRAEIARRSLYEFAKQAWPIIEPGVPFTDGYHIQAISEHLEAQTRGEIRNLLINMPPRHMKSILISVLWPAWEWVSNPYIKWFFASYAADLSIRDSIKCRRLIQSDWYQSNWGEKFSLSGDQNAKEKFENDKLGYRFATSVGGRVTGEGGDRIVVDDPHNVLDAHSAAHRETARLWWTESMPTRLNDPKKSTNTIVMQRVHEEDLSQIVLSEGGWDHLCLPARFEGEKKYTSLGWVDPRSVPGELLWPNRFDEDSMRALEKKLGSYASAGQLQQRPSPKGGGMLQAAWFKRYQVLPPLGSFDRIIASWDTTFKGKKDSKSGKPDYVVGQIWGQIGFNFYLIYQYRGQWGYTEFKKAVLQSKNDFPLALVKLIEDKGNGSAVCEELESTIPGMIPINPDGGKEVRAAAISPVMENGQIWVPEDGHVWGENSYVSTPDGSEGKPQLGSFVNEVNSFPNGANDDQVDAMTQAINWMMQNGEFELIGVSY